MTGYFPRQSPVEHSARDREEVEIATEKSVEQLGVLSSKTAQEIIAQLQGEPTTNSEIADQVDTSIQNTQYHLNQLCAAGIVTEVDTWYSERGCEMTVYALAAEELVIQFETTKHDAKITEELS